MHNTDGEGQPALVRSILEESPNGWPRWLQIVLGIVALATTLACYSPQQSGNDEHRRALKYCLDRFLNSPISNATDEKKKEQFDSIRTTGVSDLAYVLDTSMSIFRSAGRAGELESINVVFMSYSGEVPGIIASCLFVVRGDSGVYMVRSRAHGNDLAISMEENGISRTEFKGLLQEVTARSHATEPFPYLYVIVQIPMDTSLQSTISYIRADPSTMTSLGRLLPNAHRGKP
jgi:hypothetical protein